MKKMMSFLCLEFLFCQAYPQHETRILKVPDAVKNAFVLVYPNVRKVDWSLEKPGEYEGEFTQNDVETSVVISANGKILDTETVQHMADLPESVRSVLQTKFKNYKITEIEKVVDAMHKTTYEIEASKESMYYKLILDTKGLVLRKEISAGDNQD